MFALFVITSIVFLLGLFNLWLWMRRQLKNPSSYSFAIPENQLSSDVTALNAGAIGLGERLLKIERELKNMRERLEQVEMSAEGHASYEQAVYLVKRGMEANEIMQVCDLSQTEAELLVLMNQSENQSEKDYLPGLHHH